MSTDTNDGEIIELCCRLGQLSITISGPAEPATRLLTQLTTQGTTAARASSPSSTTGSFDLVSAAAAEDSQPVEPVVEYRDSILASFSPCPPAQLQLGARLSGSALPGEERARRAWKAGQWAKAVLSGRICTPNRSVQLDLRPRCYCVLRATGISRPVLCLSARTYWSIVGELSTSTSISHAFPSESEGRIYFAGAGVTEFDTRQ